MPLNDQLPAKRYMQSALGLLAFESAMLWMDPAVLAGTVGEDFNGHTVSAGSHLDPTTIPQGRWSRNNVDIGMHLGRPAVFIDGTVHHLAGYNYHGRHLKLFSRHGMGVYLIGPGSNPEDQNGTRFWSGDRISSRPIVDSPDIDTVDERAARVLEADPDSYLIVRFVTRAPASWQTLHPDAFFVTEEGERLDRPSLASDLYWDMNDRYAASLIEYVESRPWADRVVGYANFHYEEGIHRPVAQGWYFDHSEIMTTKWRAFLREKYRSDDALQAAYANPSITLDTMRVPTDRLRGPVPEVAQIPYWQAGADNRGLRDYLELTRDLFHRNFRDTSAAMAAAVDRDVIFLHDALKQVMSGWNLYGFFNYPHTGHDTSWSPAYPDLMGGSGSISVAGLFDLPGCDGLITPHDYEGRGIGGVYEPEGIVDSAVLRGKFFAGEMDQRIGTRDVGPARTPKELHALIWRNFANSFTRGYNSYWMHGFFVDDWFEEDEAQKMVHRHVEVIKESIHWPHETVPGIAMVLDDAAILETNGNGNFLHQAVIAERKLGIARCGVPVRIYLFEDLALDDFPPHRVYYFPNLFRAGKEKLEILRRKVFRDGHVVVWGPGSGISDGERIGAASATELTGFAFETLPVNAARRILVSNFEHPLTRGLDADTMIGGSQPYGPVLLPTDGLELGLAWTKGGHADIGMALKEFGRGPGGPASERGAGDYAALFMTALQIPAELWRNIARYAGAHVYCESNDVLMANKHMVALHSLKGGEKRITLPERCRVRDVVSGRDIAKNASEILFELNPPETRVFLLEE